MGSFMSKPRASRWGIPSGVKGSGVGSKPRVSAAILCFVVGRSAAVRGQKKVNVALCTAKAEVVVLAAIGDN